MVKKSSKFHRHFYHQRIKAANGFFKLQFFYPLAAFHPLGIFLK